jgi:hypothetical protein
LTKFSARFPIALAAILGGCASHVLPVGDLVPEWVLPTADGDTLSAKRLRGRPGLIVWIDPMCPQVQEAALQGGALRRIESRWMPTDSAWIVYVATRTRAEESMDLQMWRPWMKEMRLRGQVLIDTTGSLSRRLGAVRTPGAAVIDRIGALCWRGPLWMDDDSGALPLASQVLDSVLHGRDLPTWDTDLDTGCPILEHVR